MGTQVSSTPLQKSSGGTPNTDFGPSLGGGQYPRFESCPPLGAQSSRSRLRRCARTVPLSVLTVSDHTANTDHSTCISKWQVLLFLLATPYVIERLHQSRVQGVTSNIDTRNWARNIRVTRVRHAVGGRARRKLGRRCLACLRAAAVV